MRRLVVALAVALGVSLPAPVWGCSQIEPPTLDDLLQPDAPLGELVGVYEQEHIAGSPNLFLRDMRTVSVVTRYWGQPPSLGREMHGDATILGSDSCGNQSGRVGDRGFGYATDRIPRLDGRFLPHSAIGRGGLSEQEEALLLETFGPPVELGISWQTRTAAHVQLWLWPATIVLLVGVAVLGPRTYRRSRQKRASTVER